MKALEVAAENTVVMLQHVTQEPHWTDGIHEQICAQVEADGKKAAENMAAREAKYEPIGETRNARDLYEILTRAQVEAKMQYPCLARTLDDVAELATHLNHAAKDDLNALASRCSSVRSMPHGYTVFYAEKFQDAEITLGKMLEGWSR